MLICSLAYLNGQAAIDPSVVQSTIKALTAKDNSNKSGIEKGVTQVARLWQQADGDNAAFQTFCEANYIANPDEKYQVFLKISDYLEGIDGHFNEMSLRLQKACIWIMARCFLSMRSSVPTVRRLTSATIYITTRSLSSLPLTFLILHWKKRGTRSRP